MKSENQFSADKRLLRKEARHKRRTIEDKAFRDNAILNRLISLDRFKSASLILCYMALDDEINIDNIVEYAISSGKKVAVPYCTDNEGNMDYYYILSLDDLVEGSFGVREPDTEKCTVVSDFENALVVVPALCFDKYGYRLGYGKGYYDRFLQNHPLFSVGLCYNSLITDTLPREIYDKSVDLIITEDGVFSSLDGGKNG